MLHLNLLLNYKISMIFLWRQLSVVVPTFFSLRDTVKYLVIGSFNTYVVTISYDSDTTQGEEEWEGNTTS